MKLLLFYLLLYSSPTIGMNRYIINQPPQYPDVRLIPMGIDQNNSKLIKQYPSISYNVALQSTLFRNLKDDCPEMLNQPIVNIEIPNCNRYILSNLARCLNIPNATTVRAFINTLTYQDVANITHVIDFLDIQKKKIDNTPDVLLATIERLSTIATQYPKFIKKNLPLGMSEKIAHYLIASKEYDAKLLEKYSQQLNDITPLSVEFTVVAPSTRHACYFSKQTKTAIHYIKTPTEITTLYIYQHNNDMIKLKNFFFDLHAYNIKGIDTTFFNNDESIVILTGTTTIDKPYSCIINMENQNINFLPTTLCCFSEKKNVVYIAQAKTLYLYDINTKEEHLYEYFPNRITHIASSQNGALALSTEYDKTIGSHSIFIKQENGFDPQEEIIPGTNIRKQKISDLRHLEFGETLRIIHTQRYKIIKGHSISINQKSKMDIQEKTILYNPNRKLPGICHLQFNHKGNTLLITRINANLPPTIFLYHLDTNQNQPINTGSLLNVNYKGITFTSDDNILIIPYNFDYEHKGNCLFYNLSTKNFWKSPESNIQICHKENGIKLSSGKFTSVILIDTLMQQMIQDLQHNKIPLEFCIIAEQKPGNITTEQRYIDTIKKYPHLEKLLAASYPHIASRQRNANAIKSLLCTMPIMAIAFMLLLKFGNSFL